MSCRFAQLALVVSLASTIAGLGPQRVDAADAAQRIVRVGFVDPLPPSIGRVDPFWQRLRELGWVEGQNLVIEMRSADGRNDQLPRLMSEVINRKIDVLVTYSTPAAVAAKNASTTIPIVVAIMGDPIGAGVVTNLARPGGNVTGLSLEWAEGIEGKWLELLQDMVPHLSSVAVVVNPNTPVPTIQEMAKKLEAIARTRGVKIRRVQIGNPQTFENAIRQARRDAQAAIILGDVFAFEHRRQLTELAARYQLPAMYPVREYVDSGGLMAYGADRAILFHRAAEYVDKILRGTKPGDLPIEQPVKLELVVNLKTANALGLKVPESILLRADEVIR